MSAENGRAAYETGERERIASATRGVTAEIVQEPGAGSSVTRSADRRRSNEHKNGRRPSAATGRSIRPAARNVASAAERSALDPRKVVRVIGSNEDPRAVVLET